MTTPAASALTPEFQAQLSQLRDIRLPEAISYWDLAPGFWVLIIVITLLLATTVVLRIRHLRSVKFAALQELKNLQVAEAEGMPILELAARAGVLIRRVMLNSANGRRKVTLSGDEWSDILSEKPNTIPVSLARYIAMAPYRVGGHPPESGQSILQQSQFDQQQDDPTAEALIEAVENWIKRCA